MAENKDLTKSRIEVLRDALKDVQDTIRAQDRKASYIIAIEFFIISSFVYFYKFSHQLEGINEYSQLFDLFPVLFFIISIRYLFLSYSPVSNPQEVLNKDDQEFGKGKFFVFYSKDLEYSSEQLAERYLEDTAEEKGLIRVLYIEILKLSKIRERKIKYIKEANSWLLISFVFTTLQVVTLFNYNLYSFLSGLFFTIIYKACR